VIERNTTIPARRNGRSSRRLRDKPDQLVEVWWCCRAEREMGGTTQHARRFRQEGIRRPHGGPPQVEGASKSTPTDPQRLGRDRRRQARAQVHDLRRTNLDQGARGSWMVREELGTRDWRTKRRSCGDRRPQELDPWHTRRASGWSELQDGLTVPTRSAREQAAFAGRAAGDSGRRRPRSREAVDRRTGQKVVQSWHSAAGAGAGASAGTGQTWMPAAKRRPTADAGDGGGRTRREFTRE